MKFNCIVIGSFYASLLCFGDMLRTFSPMVPCLSTGILCNASFESVDLQLKGLYVDNQRTLPSLEKFAINCSIIGVTLPIVRTR